MKRILFLTNFASPYRVHFFDELGKYADVTVLYSDRVEDITHRDKSWFESGKGGFQSVQLTKTFCVKDENLCLDVLAWLKKSWDVIVIGGYSSPTAILAMTWLRLHRIPFYMEVDGGLIREESAAVYRFKRMLVSAASGWISSGKYPTDYLVHYGAKRDRIWEYPFSSLQEKDILETAVSSEEKTALREKLGIPEKKMVLSIGQFIPRKGFDILIDAAVSLDTDIGIYIVGGEPTQEYLEMVQERGLKNIHFVGFMKKEKLADYYKAADLFALPTREDIWGLVINEAMAYGLPVITTDRCVAGLELIDDGVNGYVIPVEDSKTLALRIKDVFAGDCAGMGAAALERIRPYTIENMVDAHIAILKDWR
jgi:glycosyltransferase involved in cell wall biosynthesis